MAYTDQNAVLGYISKDMLVQFTDDDGTGNVDAVVFNALVSAASTDIDGRLASLYPVPFRDQLSLRIATATQDTSADVATVDLVLTDPALYLQSGSQVTCSGLSGIDRATVVTVTDSTHVSILGTLSAAYTSGGTVIVPGVPPKVAAAAAILVVEACYARRLTPDEKNPFKARADYWRKELTAIGSGDGMSLDLAYARQFTPGYAQVSDLQMNASSQ